MLQKISTLLIAGSLMLGAVLTFATTPPAITAQPQTEVNNAKNKGITLYESPNDQAKVVATVNLDAPLMPIYRDPHNKGWLKIANRSDGAVGWIKMADWQQRFAQLHYPYFTSTTIIAQTDPDGKTTYRVVGSDTSKTMSQAEAAALFQRIQARQEMMIRRMNRMLAQSFADFGPGFPSFNDNFFNPTPPVEVVVVSPFADSAKQVGKATANSAVTTAKKLADNIPNVAAVNKNKA